MPVHLLQRAVGEMSVVVSVKVNAMEKSQSLPLLDFLPWVVCVLFFFFNLSMNMEPISFVQDNRCL